MPIQDNNLRTRMLGEKFAGEEGTGSIVDSEDKREVGPTWFGWCSKKKCKWVLNHTRREQFQSMYMNESNGKKEARK